MTALEKAQSWLQQDIDEQTRKEIEHLIAHDPQGLEEAFYKDLSFGTGGLRGVMGVGSNRMNRYTVAMATQGLANYLKKTYPQQAISVAIGHDSRHNSRHFAEITARVFAGNGITAYLFAELRPTPELSFAIRTLKCQGGVVITASHNPKKYNGYKAYWSDGAQLIAPHDQNVVHEVSRISRFSQIQMTDLNSDLIKTIGPEMDEQYRQAIVNLALDKDALQTAAQVKLVYTPIHGTGITMVPDTLRQMGFEQVHVVAEQAEPNGDFPTVVYPNPEEAEALTLGLQQARQQQADLLMATDPDADRVGIAIRTPQGDYQLVNGNQMVAMMTYYILSTRQRLGLLSPDQFMVKTIVTTDLVEKICADYGITCYNTLTGFKFIAALIRKLEGKQQFIGGGEESYGYMTSDVVRDKDAVAACALLAEMAAARQAQGSSLYELLEEIYLRYGLWHEEMVSITREGKAGQEEIAAMMQNFRNNPPASLGGATVVKILDYQQLTELDVASGTTQPLDFPQSNVLQFITEQGDKVSARPSGTEPKIKFYFSVSMPVASRDDIAPARQQLQERIAHIKAELNL